MVDFRNRQDLSNMIQQAYAAKSAVPNQGLSMVSSGMQGLQHGLQLAETIGGVMERKKQKKMIEGIVNTPEFKTFDTELKGIPSMLAKSGNVKDLAELMIKQQQTNIMKDVYTTTPEGTLEKVGQVPKSAYVSPPSPERRAEVAIQKEEKQKDIKLNKLNSAIDFFEKKINEIPSGTGLTGRLKGIGTAVEAKLQTNPKAAAYIASTEGLRSQIVRGLGDVGNLSEYEQKVAANLLPKVTDNTETKKAKIQNFRDYIKTRIEFGKESKLDLKSSKPKFEIIGVK